jgi:hypothetical protein
MAFTQGSLGGVAGGVSQQPDILRFPGQCTEQTNMLVDVVDGLRRRGELTIIKMLDAAFTTGDAYIHWFSLADVDYVAIFTSSWIKVFDLAGTSYTVYAPVTTYITTGFDPENFSSAQVGEYNMISNSTVLPEMVVTVDDEGDEYVTFHISDGMAWGVRHVIKWEGTTVADYTAPDGSTIDATTTERISSLYIAADLFADISAYATPLGWVCVLLENTIIMKRLVADYEVTAAATGWTIDDSAGGGNGTCTATLVQTLDELPPKSFPGHWVQIGGKESSSLDDFYMMYETTDGTHSTEGLWKESHDPTEVSEFNPTTMPHALIQVESGEFYFTSLDASTYGGSVVDEWAGRLAGDSESNPVPAFIGQSIFDMTVVQQRLIIVSDDHVNMSGSQREFTYWSNSALTDVDTDTIELTTPGERAAHLFAAIEHEQNLLVLGSNKQFAVPLRVPLSRSTAALVPTTSYDADTGCKPCAAARGMFFAFSDKDRSGIREYRTGEVESIHEAEEVTSHIGDYLPINLKVLDADRQDNVIIALPTDESALYVYQFLYRNGEKLISAWSRMDLTEIIPLSLRSVDGYFNIIGQHENGLAMYRLEKNSTIFLDHQITAVVAGDTADISSWIFADTATIDNIVAIITDGAYSGMQVQIESFTAGVITLKAPELFDGMTLTVGFPYESAYTPTMPVLRDSSGKAMQLDRLTVQDIFMHVSNSGIFGTELSATHYDTTEQYFSGRLVGSTFVVGAEPTSSRTERVSIGHDARGSQMRVVTNAHTDLIIQALEYRGAYTRRGMRL